MDDVDGFLDPTADTVADPLAEQQTDDQLAEVTNDPTIDPDPVFETDDFDPRSHVDDQVFGLDDSLTADGGDATDDLHGIHDLGDIADFLG